MADVINALLDRFSLLIHTTWKSAIAHLAAAVKHVQVGVQGTSAKVPRKSRRLPIHRSSF